MDPNNEVFVSAVSTWEVSIKIALGKLRLPDEQDPAVYLPDSIKRADLATLAIIPEHTYGVSSLTRHHADPFDRLLIAQARFERMTLVTSDSNIARYDVATLML